MAKRINRTVRFDEPTEAAIAAIAADEGRSWADVVRRLVAEALNGRQQNPKDGSE